MTVECVLYRQFEKGTLRGYADFFIPEMGMELRGFSLHMKDGKRWISMPSKEFKDKGTGKSKYNPVILFRDNEIHHLFCKLAIEAIDKWCVKRASEAEEPEDSDECLL